MALDRLKREHRGSIFWRVTGNAREARERRDQFGIVAEDTRMQARAFGVPVRSGSRLLLLAEMPSDWDAYAQPVDTSPVETMIERAGPADPPPPAPPGIMQRTR